MTFESTQWSKLRPTKLDVLVRKARVITHSQLAELDGSGKYTSVDVTVLTPTTTVLICFDTVEVQDFVMVVREPSEVIIPGPNVVVA